MRILVTGATGFIGSELCKQLTERGHDVYPLSRYIASEGRYDFYQLKRRIICDIRSGDRVNQIVREVRPEVVFHLAAMSAVSYSFLSLETSREVSEVIYMGTMNIAEACQTYHVPMLINASTSEFYGHQDVFPIPEEAVPQPLSPYAVAKLAAEEYLRYLGRTNSLRHCIIRPYNTYNRSRVRKEYFVVERAICGALRDGEVHLYTPYPVRDLLDRDSHVDAYIKCLDALNRINGEVVNIGLAEGHTIQQMADKVAAIVTRRTGRPVSVNFDMVPDRPHDIHTLICSNQKARELLNWHPLYNLDEGLEIAVSDWADVLGIKLERE
jgi:nucleoside-diphosphate-sugar epimerase